MAGQKRGMEIRLRAPGGRKRTRKGRANSLALLLSKAKREGRREANAQQDERI